MKWKLDEPKLGSMIRVKVGPLYHYGVYVNDDEIIQFGVNPALRQGKSESEIDVCITDIENFLCGEFLEVAIPEGAERLKWKRPKSAVDTARKRLGERGYHLLYNNCEHFAYECVTGTRYCSQTENVRNMFKNLPITDLYIASVPDGKLTRVTPAKRREQIDRTTNESLKRQRYYVWRLLEYALNRSFGYKLNELELQLSDSGKWSCKECFFSLSHTDKAVAVAVSRKPIGVDIEPYSSRHHDRFAERILTERELTEYSLLNGNKAYEYLINKWCAKESLFKQGNEEVFKPSQLDCSTGVVTKAVELDNTLYCCAVASEDTDKLRIYKDISL